jgi:hypothetical protein
MNMRGTSKGFVCRIILGFVIALAVGVITGVAEAAVGDVLKTVTSPAGAQCGTDSGSAVAIVPGGKLGFPTFPTLVVTSCQNKLFFLDPNTGTLVKTITTTVTPTAGWEAITLRPDRGDLLGCGIVSGQTALYGIDFLPSPNTTADGTATFRRNGPSGSTCEGIAWDPQDETIYQSSTLGTSTSKNVLQLAETGTGNPLRTVPSGCNSLTGVTLSGSGLFVTCAGGSTIRQLKKTDGTLVTSFNAGTNQPGDGECDQVTFALAQPWHSFRNKDVIWVKNQNAASVVAVQAAFGTCGPVPPPPICPITVSDPDGDKDSDGDGLLDCWEDGTLWPTDLRPGIALNGVYGQNPATNRFTLCVDLGSQTAGEMGGTIGFGPSAGEACASKSIPDIFVEADYMPGHRPNFDAVQDVVNAFIGAPGPPTELGPGPVRLHVQLGDQFPIHSQRIGLVPCTDAAPPGPPTVNDADFDTLKATWFGTAADRADLTLKRLNARNWVYHYGVWAHNQEPSTPANTSSGCAETPGNDFIVTLGSWNGSDPVTGHTYVGTRTEQAGTFMHELGHNLNLRHGGGDTRSASQIFADLTKFYVDTNCKPQYVSVMNYAYQMINYVADRPLDYSRFQLPTLKEGDLDEGQGVGQNLYTGNIAFGPPQGFPAKPTNKQAGGPISWDLDTITNELHIKRDLNHMTSGGACPQSGGTNPTDVYDGFQDWSKIQFNFRGSTDFAGGIGLTFDENLTPFNPNKKQEITFDQHVELSRDRCDVKSAAKSNNSGSPSNPVFNATFFSRNENGVVLVDATHLDRQTLTLRHIDGFWTLLATASKCANKDVDKDGFPDLACPFDVPQGTVITPGQVLCNGTISQFDFPPSGYDFIGASNVQ